MLPFACMYAGIWLRYFSKTTYGHVSAIAHSLFVMPQMEKKGGERVKVKTMEFTGIAAGSPSSSHTQAFISTSPSLPCFRDLLLIVNAWALVLVY